MIYGIDVSANQGSIDWSKVAASGVQFAIARATLGIGTDTRYAGYANAMKAAGLLPGAYHYLYHDEPSSAARQADHFIDVIGDPDGLLVALDAEQTGTPDYYRLQVDDVNRFVDRWNARYPGHRLLAYCPGWFWSSGPPPPFGPLWNSHYVGLRDATLTRIYATVPDSYWTGYGGWSRSTILQYTSGALVPGIGGHVDGNAYGGTRSQLATYALTAPSGGPIQSAGELVTTITLHDFLDGQRAISGTNVRLFLTDGTTKVVASLQSAASATAEIEQSDNKAPQGSGWLRLSASPNAGWYVAAASVTLAPAPPPPPPVDCTPLVEAATALIQDELDKANTRAELTAQILREQATLLGG